MVCIFPDGQRGGEGCFCAEKGVVGSMKKLSMVIAFAFLLVLTVIGNAVAV